MQPRKRSGSNLYNEISIPSQFNDMGMQQLPLKLPKLATPSAGKQSNHLKNRNYGVELPKIKENKPDEIDSLDGSEDLNQSQNYANSSDNMREQINEIRKKMNISKYSENFIQSDPAEQYIKEKHSGSSTYIRNNKIVQRQEKSKKGSQQGKRQKLMSDVNNEDNKTLITQSNKVDSDISDFQQKVQANRAIIKNNKFIKKHKQDKDRTDGKKVNLFDKKLIKQPQQALYQKRVRQYKNFSQNKYLKEKKKEIKEIALSDLKLKQKQQDNKIKPKDLIKQLNTPERTKRQSPSPNTNNQKPQLFPAQKLHSIKRRKSKLKQQMLDESPPVYPVSQNLFADINMILGKKHKSRSQFLSVGKLSSLSGHPKPKKKISLNIKQLERSFRMLQEQQTKLLGYKKDPQDLKVSINKSLIEPSNLLQWQRIAISDNRRELNLIESNFVNEVDRINSFHQKNQQSLETYIANRELLIELELQQRLKELSPMKARTDIVGAERLQFD